MLYCGNFFFAATFWKGLILVTTFIFLKDFIFASFWTCWVASFLDSGKSLTEASYSLGIFFLSIAVLEIPTGYIADRFGKKLSSLLGIAIVGLGFLFNGLEPSRTLQLFSFGLAGLGFTLMSGASTAWLYNLAKKESFFQHEGFFFRVEMIGRLATLTGSFFSVYLLQFNPSFLWIGMSVIGFANLLIGSGLPSDKGQETVSMPTFNIISDALLQLQNPAILWIMIASLFFGIESSIRNLIYQPYVIDLNKGNVWFLAVFQSTLAIARMLGIKFYQKKLMNLNRSIGLATASMIVFAVAEFVASQTNNFSVFIFFYAAAIFSLGWFFPIKDAHLNRNLADHSRATVLSINSMIENLFSALGCLVLSLKLTESPLKSFWSYGGAFLLLTAFSIFMSGRTKKLKPIEVSV